MYRDLGGYMQLGQKILKFDQMEANNTNTVGNFNELFNYHQILDYDDNVLVEILDPQTSLIRNVRIDGKFTRHDFSHCTNEEVRNINHAKKMAGKNKNGAGGRYTYKLIIEKEFIGVYDSIKEVAAELECTSSGVSYYITRNTAADKGIRVIKTKIIKEK